MNLQEFRTQFPQYKDVPDDALADSLFEKYYSGKMSRDDFRAQVGLSPPAEPEPAPVEVPPRASLAEVTARRRPEGLPEGVKFGPGPTRTRAPVATEIERRLAGAVARGVDIETGAPAGARARGSFGGTEEDVAEGVKIGLAKAYGKPVQIRKGSEGLEFLNPETEQWTLVNPPGLDLNDFASLAGEAVSIGPEIAGAVAGSVLSPGAGSVSGAALGAFVGEYTRLRVGQRMGVNADMSDEEVVTAAAINAGIAAAGGAVGMGLVKLGRVLLSGIPSPIAKSVGTKLDEGLEATANLKTEVQRRTGRDLDLTTGQTVRTADPNAPIAGAERSIAGTDAGSGIRETYRGQQETVDELQRRISEPFKVPGSPETLTERAGRSVQEAAGAGPRRGMAVIEGRTEQARTAARTAFERESDNALPPQEAGVLAREKLQTGRDTTQAAFGQRYDEIDALAEGKAVDLTNVRAAGSKWSKTINDDILPSLAVEDVPVIRDAAVAGTKEVSGVVVERPATFSAVQRTLSTLRDEIRAAEKGFTRKSVIALRELRDALLKDRDAALEGNPQLRDAIVAVENDYRAAKTAIDRSLVGELVRKAEGGGYVLRDDQVINRILQNPSGAKAIASVVNDPKYASFAEAREPIRRGLLGKWAEAVTNAETGAVSPTANASFLRKNRATLEQFFTPGELQKLEVPGAAARLLQQAERREARAVANLNKSFGMNLQGYDAAEVVDKTWQAGRVGDVRRIKRITGEDSPEWKSYRAAALQKLWRETSTWDDAATAYRVTAADLSKRLEGREAALLRETFGDRFVNDLTVLRDTIKAVEPPKGGPAQIVSGQASALRHLARAYVGMFTTAGRVLTAGLRIRGKAAERQLIDALSDPERLSELIKLRTMKPSDKRAAALLGSSGALILTED